MTLSDRLSYADALWPLIRIRWPGHAVSDASLERTYEDLATLIVKGDHVSLVTFGDMHPHFTALQRQYIAGFIGSHHETLTRNCKGLAIVSLETDARGLVTSLNWQSSTPFERGLFATRARAMAWLSGRWEHFTGKRLELDRDA